MAIPTLHEIEHGEGNGVIHWYCSSEHREQETNDYGDVDPINLESDEVPEGAICEVCCREIRR
jgi:hypothetical protein